MAKGTPIALSEEAWMILVSWIHAGKTRAGSRSVRA
jgi:hypothetical protein